MPKRLENIIPELIDTDQTGFIKNRQTWDNVSCVLFVVDSMSKNNSKSLTMSLDAEKAFDLVSRKSLYLVLQHFGLSDAVIGCLKTICHSPTGRIKINSNLFDVVTPEFTRCHFDKNIEINELTEISLINVIIDEIGRA